MQQILVLLLLSLFGALAGSVVEKATGLAFPESSGTFPALSLAGVGVRVKQVGPVAAKVYAVGVHVPRSSVVGRLRALRSKSGQDVEKHLAAVIGQDAHFTLKMARDVKSETMASALADAIKPRMQGKDGAALQSLEKLILGSFTSTGGSCKKGAELKFTCGKSSVGVTINGSKRGDVSSAVLSRAFIQTYTDTNSVSASLRQSLGATLFGWSTNA